MQRQTIGVVASRGGRKPARWTRRLLGGLTTLILLALAAGDVRAEVSFGFYLGRAETRDSDVRLMLDDGTDLTFENVSWRDESFTSPQYWGVRFTYWLPERSPWGIGFDLTHVKMFAELDETVTVRGVRQGVPVSGTELLRDTFTQLSISHGYNLLTINGNYRWGAERRVTPYVGAGIGVALPHVEVNLDNELTDEYQSTWPALEVLGGARFGIVRHFAIFVEGKLSYAQIRADLTGGGKLSTDPWTGHLVLGFLGEF